MSGSIDYSLLYSSASSDSSDASDTITALAATGRVSSSSGGGDPLAALKSAEANETTDIAQTAKEPTVQRAIAAFTTAVGKATDIKTLLQNPDVLNVLLTANGLGDQVGYPALAQKALLSNLSDPNSLANQLGDTRWKTAASTYNFATTGLTSLQNPKVIATLTNAYAEVTWRNSLDAATPGLSNALDFLSRANTITSAVQILGDSTFRTVVTGALGIPPQIAYQDLPAQEQAITSQIDVSRFKNPQFVNSITDRYLLQAQSSSDSDASSSSLTSLAIQAQGLVV